MKQHFGLRRWALMAGLCLLLVGILTVSLGWATASSSSPTSVVSSSSGEAAPQARSRTPDDQGQAAAAVRRAWERARDVGVYDFVTDLSEANYPARSLANAGRGPQRIEMHMEGEVDQPARTLEFRLWQPGLTGSGGAHSVAQLDGGAEARIEGNRAFLRPAGGEWKEVEDFSASFAPDNDPLAFLHGIKDIADCELPIADSEFQSAINNTRNHGTGSPQSAISCYSFNLDGPALAAYMRDQLERQLADTGELPLGVTLEAPNSFRDMTGIGELWVDGRGLPLRLAMHLAFPEARNGARLEADLQTGFSGFPKQLAAAPKFTADPLAWADFQLSQSAVVNRQLSIEGVAETGGAGGALACGLGVAALLLAGRRSRRLYAAVAIAVTFSMVIVPLMQSERAVAFFERQAARAPGLMSLGSEGLPPRLGGRGAAGVGPVSRPVGPDRRTWPGQPGRGAARARRTLAAGHPYANPNAAAMGLEL